MNPALRGSAAHVFVESLEALELRPEDDHHLRRVLRIGSGERITVADGKGCWAEAVLEPGLARVVSAIATEPRPPRAAVLSAVPKGERLEWMVQKLTELGATAIGFVDCSRSVVRWDAARAERQLQRVQRVCREAAMQSRRVWLPELCGIVPFDAVLGPGVAIADPDGTTLLAAGIDTVVIGPEGGFTPDELASGAPVVALSPHVLRIETAAVVAAVMLTLRHDSW